MGLISWLTSRISGTSTDEEIDISSFFDITSELYARKLAFQTAVNLIANSISKCEFRTYLNKKEVKEKEHYLFNVEPNINQNSSEFIHKWISKLYKNNECLIIEKKGQLFIADTFNKNEYALKDNVFTQVTIGDSEFNRSFLMSEVLYFKLNAEDIKTVINGMYETYGKMIAYGQNGYQKSNGNRGILEVSGVAQGKGNFESTFKSLMNNRFKSFFDSNNAVLPLFDGYSYEDLTKNKQKETSRDIKAMIDDIYDFTARAFRIPPVLLKGEIASVKDTTNNYLTFCIDPLADMFQEEINRKRSGYSGHRDGTYLKIDTKSIKHIDLLSVASSIDKLIGSGVFNINDIKRVIGDEPIDEEWANKHFMTKNYSTIEEFLEELKNLKDKVEENDE